MRFLLVTLLAMASSTAVLGASMYEPRQADCSSYGEYEEYTGPCETSNCGASGTVCRNGQGCVVFPSFACPAKGCACTSY
ncbi:hypothetical protein FA10DRAFT_266540 [Acaromyces ingoldii]|uniref:Uncharacterized protein n=1 Tax=Acaromyces ingoldii TaxID=215250 RepID=A0A316YKD8_9BASI|nr:hypothetical protein FA10DRAFT_266540 [Acaromyces ingoldii]PWN90020.1 hypothetical protein FA10DRAFT_266540 [Acaromyces ingoldii]